MNADVIYGEDTAQLALRRTLRAWGYDIEPDKRQANGPKPIALGGEIDLTEVSTRGVAKAQPDPKKRAELYGKLEVLEREGMCPGEEADAIVGKGRWMTMQHYLHVGAAALQPFAQRARGSVRAA